MSNQIFRFSSRREALDQVFLSKRLQGARVYKRIAGYFRSSIFDLIGEDVESIEEVKIVCNSDFDCDDLKMLSQATIDSWFREKWNEEANRHHPLIERQRYRRLHTILSKGNIEIRVVPAKKLFLHGKAGVIESKKGVKTSFVGSVNETSRAFSGNYELVWEDTSAEAVLWVEQEFDSLWKLSVPLPAVILDEIERLANREEIPIDRCSPKDLPGAALAESPLYRGGEMLQSWQKAFVLQFMQHRKQYGYSRLLLADEVGLGKTLSLATCALLSALQNEGPILILVPKTLAEQWQTELWERLEIPTAVWTNQKGRKGWLDNQGYFSQSQQGFRGVTACPCQIAIVSTGLITHLTDERQELLRKSFGMIILDEAHKARRKWTKGENQEAHNNLLDFMRQAAAKTRHVLLGTATPIQTDPQDLWDLIGILDQEVPCVLGKYSNWSDCSKAFPLITGKKRCESPDEAWEWLRNPLPPKSEDDLFRWIRQDLDIPEDFHLTDRSLNSLGRDLQDELSDKIEHHEKEPSFLEKHNPIVRHTVFRLRAELEKKRLLTSIKVNIHPHSSCLYGNSIYPPGSVALTTTISFDRAYRAAEKYTECLKKRFKAAGFVKTFLLRRICSSYEAGITTTKRLLRQETTLPEGSEIDELNEEIDTSPLIPRTPEEHAALEKIVDCLEQEKGQDPKFNAIRYFLTSHQTEKKTWLEHGCIIFSQYYDTAEWIAGQLTKHLENETIALYAGRDKSRILQKKAKQPIQRDEIKKQVRQGKIRLIIATNAACEGLNLQSLGTLINMDLPWNPAVLEQRLGRIKRIGQKRPLVDMLNLVYQNTVDQKVYEVLSERMQDGYDLFGKLPETISDDWVEKTKEELEENIDKSAEEKIAGKNAFTERYQAHLDTSEHCWEKCAKVLSRRDITEKLSKPW